MNISKEAKLSSTFFLLPILLIHVIILFLHNRPKYLLIFAASTCSTLHILIQNIYRKKCNGLYFQYRISLIALLLGELFCIGCSLIYFGFSLLKPFGIYLNILSFFHFSEFFFISIIKPELVNIDSYLLQNGHSYYIALFVSITEYFIEAYYFPNMKSLTIVSLIGFFMSIIGEIFRKCAMITASSNFNHKIIFKKCKNHKLVTHGIYSWFRHPAYVGWLYWAIGTQLVLLNPICFVTYIIVTWRFFNQRIRSEEITLLNFFGKEYMDYQKKVSTGILFINGYLIDNKKNN